MRKAAILMVAALVLVFAASQVFSGESCTAAKKDGSNAAAKTKSACTANKTGDAKMSMASATMTPEECAKACGMTPEECKQLCAEHDGSGYTVINIKGMTCTGCEQAVMSALEGVEGVKKVIKVDHKEGLALVCTMKDKVKNDNMTKAISAKGFTAEIIPAVATATETTVENVSMKSGCDPKTCAASAKKGCCPSGTTKTEKKTSGSN